MMGQNVSLGYTHAPTLLHCFIRVKIDFDRKILFFPLKDVRFMY